MTCGYVRAGPAQMTCGYVRAGPAQFLFFSQKALHLGEGPSSRGRPFVLF